MKTTTRVRTTSAISSSTWSVQGLNVQNRSLGFLSLIHGRGIDVPAASILLWCCFCENFDIADITMRRTAARTAPDCEGGYAQRFRGTALTRRFAPPSPGGRGTRPKD